MFDNGTEKEVFPYVGPESRVWLGWNLVSVKTVPYDYYVIFTLIKLLCPVDWDII